jgi:hypothetical protein
MVVPPGAVSEDIKDAAPSSGTVKFKTRPRFNGE